MPINGSGPVSLAGSTVGQSIALELGLSATGTINLNQTNVRTLAGVASGAISLSNFYGKANTYTYTMTSNTLNGNLRTLVVNSGWNQSTNVTANINSGVYAYANSTAQRGLVINGSFPNGVTLNNSGFIIGMGGNGGNANYACNGSPGAAGGLALLVQSPVSVNNTGTIGGGGGGGGGGGAGYVSQNWGGGGGGGGRTGLTNTSGGAGGGINPPSPCPCGGPPIPCSGAVGGSGGAGTVSGGGGGGAGGGVAFYGGGNGGGPGGSGGGWGANGGGGSPGRYVSFPTPGGGGGAAGAATSGSASFITWIATGTRNGAIG
jgi:hypothetical protein